MHCTPFTHRDHSLGSSDLQELFERASWALRRFTMISGRLARDYQARSSHPKGG